MAAIGMLSADIRRQRILLRLIAYGGAAALLISATVAGYLDRPAIPVALALAGFVFALPAERLQPAMFWAAAVFDALAVVALALITDSLLLGGLALAVAALTLSIGKPPSTIFPIGVVSTASLVALLLIEKNFLTVPRFLPVLDPPADTVAAFTMTIVIAATGVTGLRRLLSMYGLAAARVEDSTRRWWHFMEQADDPMLVTVDGVVARINPAAETLLGRSAAEARGVRLGDLVTGDSRLVRPTGESADVDVVTAPLAIEGGLSEVVFIRDVTARISDYRALQETVRETDRFVASVSHEVRTPLTAVVGLSSIVDETWDDLDDDEMREMIRLIATQSREVSAIIEDLLVAAQGRTVGLRVSHEVVSVRGEIDRVVESLQLSTDKVRVSGNADAIADAGRVRQIIRNLVTNAIRYGGDDIAVSAGSNGTVTFVEISDNGEPIPQGTRDRIFEPFARADDHEGPVESVGLGLSVSRQLAEMMGGALTYDHSDGRSRFHLALPASS